MNNNEKAKIKAQALEDKLDAKANRANTQESEDEEPQKNAPLRVRGGGDEDDLDPPEIVPVDASEVGMDDNTIKPFRIDTFVNTTRFIA